MLPLKDCRGYRFNSRSRMGSDPLLRILRHQTPVSIHAPAWGATCKPFSSSSSNPVSIHAPAWGATNLFCLSPSSRCVSIHAPAWGATQLEAALTAMARFQFTLPHGERRGGAGDRSGRCGFNSRSRMGSDLMAPALSPYTAVSIHAPAWGATRPRWRRRCQSHRFNSRSRMGSDPPVAFDVDHVGVSIHAPAWGATPRKHLVGAFAVVSIHAPAWGATDD